MIADGWLFAVATGGLTAVGPGAEIEVAFENAPPDPGGLLAALRSGAGGAQVSRAAGIGDSAASELLEGLSQAGALTESATDDLPGHSLRSALVDGPLGHGAHELIWTAEEVLILPFPLDEPARKAVLQAFIAGIEPYERLRAYSQLLGGSGDVAGDKPDCTQLEGLTAEAGEVAVFELAPGGRVWHLPVQEVAALDASAAHRLGPIAQLHEPEDFSAEGMPDLWFTVGEIAEAQLASPTPSIDRRVQGSGEREHSRLAARAEGAERFALAAGGAGEQKRAEFGELEAAIDPAALFAYNARQIGERDSDPAHHGERLWRAARTLAGEPRWLPAELAGAAVPSPLPLTSSGMAAHTDPALAESAALGELVERDAFMWTWIQRISRERIAPASLPEDVARWARALDQQGWAAHWVNLTMEFQPVVLCCLVHPERGLVLGAASRASAAAALRKSTLEALVLALRFDPSTQSPVAPDAVRTPADHLLMHMDPSRRSASSFLYASEVQIELSEIDRHEDLGAAFAEAGIEAVILDLTNPQSRPFHVVRAVAPGLVPITFGWDSEPLGLAALARPRVRHDGSPIGTQLDLSQSPAFDPHPFA